MLAAASLVATLLSSSALADEACGGDSSVIWTQPSTAKFTSDSEAVFRVLVGGGTSPASDFVLRLDHRGEDVPATVEITEHPGEKAYETRYLYTLVPDAPLVAGERYTFDVQHVSGDADLGREVAVTVDAVPAPPVQGVPEVSIQTAYDDIGEGETSCDYGEMRTFELTLTPAEHDQTERSVLHLYRMESETAHWHYVQAYRVPEDGSPLALVLSFDRGLDWGGCFAVEQEDANGNISLASNLACAAEPLLPTEDDDTDQAEGAVDSSPRGCSSAGAMTGWAMMWLATLLVVSRRER